MVLQIRFGKGRYDKVGLGAFNSGRARFDQSHN